MHRILFIDENGRTVITAKPMMRNLVGSKKCAVKLWPDFDEPKGFEQPRVTQCVRDAVKLTLWEKFVLFVIGLWVPLEDSLDARTMFAQ